ncbi:MAG: L,D-transpeptidase [Chlamydiales bacterium]|nr:L,D-transpeptidase [Chlamydiales bacterium]
MSLPRIFLIVSVLLFGGIGVLALVKRNKAPKAETTVVAQELPVATNQSQVIEIDLATLQPATSSVVAPKPVVVDQPQEISAEVAAYSDTPECDKINLLFQKNSPLPIVETIPYKSKVSWKTGRSAWLVDYAAHHKTHLHFIARSMNGPNKIDYNPRPPREGESINVLSSKVNFYFQTIIDISRCKLMLYAVMPDAAEYVLLKTYPVSLGRLDSTKASGSLTPIGKYSLGSRVAIYQPKMMGTYRGNRTEMITVFGTRWIPLDKELGPCTEPAKGYGIHGTPWHHDDNGKLVDNTESIGKYESDGCIRMRAQDIEEVFAIVSTRPTVVEIVSDFSKAVLPGKEQMY